ncbi:hypothetical protein, partial [Klebsiella pneumoniae]|uniref:hypothetical protein n=1 Tax=Klebsiella pneumoniae TaxID=573 RepID=UPI0013303774
IRDPSSSRGLGDVYKRQHFGWPRSRVAKAMRYYLMSIGLIVPLIMALIMFDNLNDREFSASLGRLCFLLICGALAVVTLSLK